MTFAAIDWIPLTIGCVFAAFAVGTAYESIRILVRGVVASGTVIGYKEVEDCFCPIVEFTDRSGSTRRFTSSSGRGVRQYADGARVTVVYDPLHPRRTQIRAFWSLWIFPAFMSLFAMLLIAAGFGLFSQE